MGKKKDKKNSEREADRAIGKLVNRLVKERTREGQAQTRVPDGTSVQEVIITPNDHGRMDPKVLAAISDMSHHTVSDYEANIMEGFSGIAPKCEPVDFYDGMIYALAAFLGAIHPVVGDALYKGINNPMAKVYAVASAMLATSCDLRVSAAKAAEFPSEIDMPGKERNRGKP